MNTFGTGRVADEVLERYIMRNFDMRPKALIDELGLLAPIYYNTAAYGHFGRGEFPWEHTHRAAKMADDLSRPSAALAHGKAKNGTAKNGGASDSPPKSKKSAKKLKVRGFSAEA